MYVTSLMDRAEQYVHIPMRGTARPIYVRRMTPSILVVGAGIAGQAFARALSQRGLHCTLVEQRPQAPGLGMGLNLPGNAIRALGALEVADRVTAAGMPVQRREYRNSADRLLFETDDADFWQDVGTPHCVRHGHVLDAVAGSTPVERGSRVTGAVPTPDSVDVQIDGDPEPRRYDLVVGADGVNSSVRDAVASEKRTHSAMTQSSWRCVVANPGVDCWTAWSGSAGTCLIIPVDPEQVYVYASATRGGDTGADPSWLADTFADFPRPVTKAVTAALADIGELYRSAVNEVRLPRWHNGRLVLIGDAAHATGPVWAQGVAMALEDALVLADLLATSQDWSGVGEQFERVRRPRVEHVQAATDKMSRLARLPGWLRDRAAPTLGPTAYRKAYGPLRQPVP